MRLKNKRANIRMSARHCTAAVEKRSRQVILYQGLTLWLADVSIERINEGNRVEGYIHQIGEKDVKLRSFSKSPIHDTAASPVATHIGQQGELSLSAQSIDECMHACTNEMMHFFSSGVSRALEVNDSPIPYLSRPEHRLSIVLHSFSLVAFFSSSSVLLMSSHSFIWKRHQYLIMSFEQLFPGNSQANSCDDCSYSKQIWSLKLLSGCVRI